MGEQLDLLTLSPAVSPAKMLAPPANVPDLLAPGRGCGSKCSESCAKCGRLGLLLRTSLAYELTALTGCYRTWNQLTTPAGRSWWALTTADCPTDENESGLLPDAWNARRWSTATARDWKDTAGQATCNEDHHHCDLLPRQVFALWQDAAKNSTLGKQGEPSILLNADWVLQLMGYPAEWGRLSTSNDCAPPVIP